MSNKKGLIFWIAFGAGLIVFFVGMGRNAPQRYSGKASGTVTEQEIVTTTVQPSRGITTITQTEWHGVPSINPSQRTEWKMLTPDVWWQVRLDGHDDRIFDCYPANWKSGSHLELPDSNLVEWRIKPGEKMTQATVAWVITDRK